MNLTHDNYHGAESNKAFFSASQIRNLLACPARTIAIMNGTFEELDREWMYLGNYIDKMLLTPAEFPKWISDEKNAEWFFTKRDRKPNALHLLADSMVARCRSDELFMRTISGKHQELIQFELFGHPFKAALDICDFELNYYADLKGPADFEDEWDIEARTRVPWYDMYFLQLAIYREAWKSKTNSYPDAEFLCAVSKHKTFPDLQIVAFDDGHLPRFAVELAKVEAKIDEWAAMKRGDIPAAACKKSSCDYCRKNRVLTEDTIIAARDWTSENRMRKEFV